MNEYHTSYDNMVRILLVDYNEIYYLIKWYLQVHLNLIFQHQDILTHKRIYISIYHITHNKDKDLGDQKVLVNTSKVFSW